MTQSNDNIKTTVLKPGESMEIDLFPKPNQVPEIDEQTIKYDLLKLKTPDGKYMISSVAVNYGDLKVVIDYILSLLSLSNTKAYEKGYKDGKIDSKR